MASRKLADRISKKTRRSVKKLLDSSVEQAIRIMWQYRIPKPLPARLIKILAHSCADVCNLLLELPRLQVWTMSGLDLKILYVGNNQKSFKKIQTLFIDKSIDCGLVGEIGYWQLREKTGEWLSTDVDMVICEMSRARPIRSWSPVTLTVTPWVDQVISIPESITDLLAGSRRSRVRRRINNFHKEGYSWRFSQTRNDFDLFYQRMYRPFIENRHGDGAIISPAQVQWDRWLSSGRGGLVLVEHDSVPVAGCICHIANETCYDIAMGVLDADPGLLQQGINAYLLWAACEWGYSQGAKRYNLGVSPGWQSNGTFRWKAQWGAEVMRRQMPYRPWTLLARQLSPPLSSRINQIGFICEHKRAFYGVRMNDGVEPELNTKLRGELCKAKEDGLSGLAMMNSQGALNYLSHYGS